MVADEFDEYISWRCGIGGSGKKPCGWVALQLSERMRWSGILRKESGESVFSLTKVSW